MKKNIKQTTEYILTEKEAKVIKNCLNYAFHRITKHDKYYPPDLKQINKLRKELDAN